jgi:hypothetical protein
MRTIYSIIVTVLTLSIGVLSSETVLALDNADDVTVNTTVENDNDQLFKTLERSLIFGLDSEHNSVVESVLYNAVEFKTVYPEFQSEKVVQALIRTMNEGATHVVRYKAYLTLYYYKNQNDFGPVEELTDVLESQNPNGIFFYIDEKLRDNQLTYR